MADPIHLTFGSKPREVDEGPSLSFLIGAIGSSGTMIEEHLALVADGRQTNPLGKALALQAITRLESYLTQARSLLTGENNTPRGAA